MTEYTYDDTGRLISCRYHNGRRLDYEYDTKGNLIHETEYRKDGTFAGRKEYGYDERGNQVSSAEFDEAEKGIDAR
ncbi:MAG: RHS repeat domain-containing protein [Eubacteriales bacterium]|nr:RHS repeat domain-containing protein [Eubacteriales bacterium]